MISLYKHFLDVQGFLNTNYDCQQEQCLNLYFMSNLYIAREERIQARMLAISQEIIFSPSMH